MKLCLALNPDWSIKDVFQAVGIILSLSLGGWNLFVGQTNRGGDRRLRAFDDKIGTGLITQLAELMYIREEILALKLSDDHPQIVSELKRLQNDKLTPVLMKVASILQMANVDNSIRGDDWRLCVDPVWDGLLESFDAAQNLEANLTKVKSRITSIAKKTNDLHSTLICKLATERARLTKIF